MIKGLSSTNDRLQRGMDFEVLSNSSRFCKKLGMGLPSQSTWLMTDTGANDPLFPTCCPPGILFNAQI